MSEAEKMALDSATTSTASSMISFYLLPREVVQGSGLLHESGVWRSEVWGKRDILVERTAEKQLSTSGLKRAICESAKRDFPGADESQFNVYMFRIQASPQTQETDAAPCKNGSFYPVESDSDLHEFMSEDATASEEKSLFLYVNKECENIERKLCPDTVEPGYLGHHLLEDDMEQPLNMSSIISPRRTGRKKGSQNLPAKSIFGRSDLTETESTDLNNALKKRKTIVISNAIKQVKKEGKRLKKSVIIPKALVLFVNETFIELTKVYKWPESRALRVLNYPKVRSNLNHRVIRAYGHMMRHSRIEDIVEQTETGSETSYVSNRLIIRDSNAIVLNSDESLSNESETEEPSPSKSNVSSRGSRRKSATNHDISVFKKMCLSKSPKGSLSSQQGNPNERQGSVFPKVPHKVVNKVIYMSMGTATLHLNTYFNLRKKKGMRANHFLVMDEEQKKRLIEQEMLRFGVEKVATADDLEGMQLQLLTILEEPHVGWLKRTAEESETNDEDEFEIMASLVPAGDD